jgi:glycosyltransferase involved in cell wall biosynthesis
MLEQCVAAIARQHLTSFELIVVDDGSTDDTAEAIERLGAHSAFDLRLVRQPRSGGPASARNQGWRAARAEFVAFTDDDCEPAPGWLSILVQCLGGMGPEVAG